jgi:hypothetical protein
MADRKTTAQFIQDARKVHGDKYDYSLAEYINSKTKVDIICPVHGVYSKIPIRHEDGSGCPDCYGKKKKTTAQFIQQARKVHGDKYDYSLAEYINGTTKIKVICPKHGFFYQEANSHLFGCGCPKCGAMSSADLLRKTTAEFIKDARKVHGDKYDYSLAEYIDSETKIKIICTEHGVFEQIPNVHSRGHGCPYCSQTGFNKEKEGILYFLKFKKDFATFWKIGITNRTVDSRFGGDALFITDRQEWHFDKGLYAYQIEQTILKEFAKFRYEMPLFSLLHLGGDTECFSPSLPSQKVIDTVERLRERIKQK